MKRDSERVKLNAIVPLTGLTVRGLQALAARGEIPSAAKLGRDWTFDPKAVKAWVEEQVEKCQAGREKAKPTSIGGASPGGPASKFPARTSDAAYEQAIGRKRANG